MPKYKLNLSLEFDHVVIDTDEKNYGLNKEECADMEGFKTYIEMYHKPDFTRVDSIELVDSNING